jgi:hypothetical protein
MALTIKKYDETTSEEAKEIIRRGESKWKMQSPYGCLNQRLV